MTVIRRPLCLVLLLAVPLLALAPGCTVLRVESDPDDPTVRARGLVRGHATFGFSDEDRIANVRLLGGSSRGAVAEVVIWKLLRVEAGLAGLSIGIGPLHLGLGALFYDPRPPRLPAKERVEPEPCPAGSSDAPGNEIPPEADEDVGGSGTSARRSGVTELRGAEL